jgi:beta-lactamase regulating signal transducer with metallopeptidase domain
MSFFYSFILTLLHSIWQTAFLLLTYVCINICFRNVHPLQKRNALYFLTALQILISLFTFGILFTGRSVSSENILTGFNASPFLKVYAIPLFFIWMLIAFTRTGFTVYRWIGFKRNLMQDLLHPQSALKVFTRLKSFELGIKRNVKIWISDKISSPLTYGCIKPVIMLPFMLINNISEDDAEAIILHELVHIKNADYLLNLLIIAAEIIYFFNPFIFIISQKIKLEREKNCDITVMQFQYDAGNYAQILLKIAKHKVNVQGMHIAGTGKFSSLLERIKYFSQDKNKSPQKINFNFILFPATIFLISFSLFFLSAEKKVSSEKNRFVSKNILSKNDLNETMKLETISVEAPSLKQETASRGLKKHGMKTPVKQKYAEHILNGDEKEINFIPVSMPASADSVKEFTYFIETAQGKITQTYRVSLISGQWIFEPLWMITEINPDSSFIKIQKDSIQ